MAKQYQDPAKRRGGKSQIAKVAHKAGQIHHNLFLAFNLKLKGMN